MTVAASAVVGRAMRAWRPPPKLSLSEWADREFVLSAESAAEPGRWHTIPYQRGIMDAITDPEVSDVTMMKSARVGYTSILSAGIGYFIAHDPCSQLVVQPTVDDGKEFSKETIAPMLRDVPTLAKVRFREFEEKGGGPKEASNTLTHKAFPGGILSIIGANSGTGFRRKTRRVVWFDEVDAYPPSAGNEGDPIKLGKKRNETFWNRKTIAGSTALIAGASRIEEMFRSGDQRRYYVPCPHCGHMDYLVFREQPKDGDAEPRGHWMGWDEGKPETAHFICRRGGCVIEHKDKRWMVERGEWRAHAPFKGHASFHIWAAYSYSPNATWGDIAAEFIEAHAGGPEKLKTFVNTTLGETWTERGEAPDWQRLYQRRESYEKGIVPSGALFLTAGMDVQADRLVWEVVAWGEDRQSWSVAQGVIPGDTAKDETWNASDELLGQTWPDATGVLHPVRVFAVDSGFNTQHVYAWARRHVGRVIACKGSSTAKTLLGAPTNVDVKHNGKRYARGCKVWPVGVDQAKAELYGWLRLDPPTKESGKPYPPGYCHFPEHGEDFFKQLTAEHLVKTVTRKGYVHLEWQVIPNRENHVLDCRVYARAATVLCRLDQIAAAAAARSRAGAPGANSAPPPPAAALGSDGGGPEVPAPSVHLPSRRPGGIIGGRGGIGRGGWLKKR